MNHEKLYDLLEKKVTQFNKPDFISEDPIGIPHRFSIKQDIEISAFFASLLAWGQRKTIINKTNLLMEYMDESPYDFMLHHSDNDLKKFTSFVHRTFNATDALYFIEFLSYHYKNNDSLESAFISTGNTMESNLIHFRDYFFSLPDSPDRTKKHVASPIKKSACKRINMFLRWMVRKDDCGVDFGIWNTIKSSDLICPLDVHVDRIARRYGLLERKQSDWKAAVELTNNLKKYDKNDPVKYDFALFGIGIDEKIFLPS